MGNRELELRIYLQKSPPWKKGGWRDSLNSQDDLPDLILVARR